MLIFMKLVIFLSLKRRKMSENNVVPSVCFVVFSADSTKELNKND